jgi:hypothetical protein
MVSSDGSYGREWGGDVVTVGRLLDIVAEGSTPDYG